MAEPTPELTAKAHHWMRQVLGRRWPDTPVSVTASLASLLAEVQEEEFRPLSELAQERGFPESWNGDEIANGLREIIAGLAEPAPEKEGVK